MIINQTEMFAELSKLGVKKNDIQAIYLFGSHYWGYAGPDSDIDLYVILHQAVELNPDYKKGVYSFHYLLPVSQVQEKIRKGSWPSFYVLRYASKLIYGERILVPDFDPKTMAIYLQRKQVLVAQLPKTDLKNAFITAMVRIFFINYFEQKLDTFRITDFEKCKQLTAAEKMLLANSLAKTRARELARDIKTKRDLKRLVQRLDAIIKQLIQK